MGFLFSDWVPRAWRRKTEAYVFLCIFRPDSVARRQKVVIAGAKNLLKTPYFSCVTTL